MQRLTGFFTHVDKLIISQVCLLLDLK